MSKQGPLEKLRGHELVPGHYGPGLGITGPLIYDDAGDGETVTLAAPFCVQAGGRIIDVPAGFETNFASTPRFFWRVCPRWGRWNVAAVVHDYLYGCGPELGFGRDEADAVFYDLCLRMGVAPWKAWAMYAALRAFGWLAWRACRRGDTLRPGTAGGR